MVSPVSTPKPVAPVGKGTMFWRGFTRRCARCGGGKLFKSYLNMVDDCPTCGLHFEREDGYWGGALAINIIATGGLFCIVFVIALIITIPNVPVAPLLAILVPSRYRQMVVRAAEYGNDRIVVGAHYAMDVIGGRATSLHALENLLANDPAYVGQIRVNPAVLDPASADTSRSWPSRRR